MTEPVFGTDRFINREFSWLQFNARVLGEAERDDNPLLERLRFLSIFESNLDEFYMVRVSGLIEQATEAVSKPGPDGLSPAEQLEMIGPIARGMRMRAARLWKEELRPLLLSKGVELCRSQDLSAKAQAQLTKYFQTEVFPLCTPLVLSPNSTLPFISNRSLNIAVVIQNGGSVPMIARVKVPTVLPRLVKTDRKNQFVLLEEIIQHHLHLLFPNVEILDSWMFRVVRDADIEIRELEAMDLMASIEGMIRKRRFGDPVLLETEAAMQPEIRNRLLAMLELDPIDSFEVEGVLGLDVMGELANLNLSSHKFPLHTPYASESTSTSTRLFKTVEKQDVLVHHPYDSFRSVAAFVASAAQDPDVIGIKQTLYRVGAESPIVESLLAAAESGKQVAVMVELKARFDESNNMLWAKALERAGVHVSYGFHEMKVHCKLCHVVRRSGGKTRSYAHIGTGNYNPSTGRLYTDLGLFTCNPEITQDVSELFNFLTGFNRQEDYRRILVAPFGLREGILERIERETAIHKKKGGGTIIFKLNALVDDEVIDALYEASQAGVQIDLIARGISCCRPGVAGLSENIRVRSIVGRFLEHSRAYYFGNGGKAEAFIGSADLMPRNLDRRIEVLTPILSPALVTLLRENLLEPCLRDNTNSWVAQSNGRYHRLEREPGEATYSAQSELSKRPFGQLQFGK